MIVSGAFSPANPKLAALAGLNGSTDLFAAAVCLTRMPIVITDAKLADNPIVFANEAFGHLTGYDPDEIIGRNCRFLQGAETDPVAIRNIRDAVAAGTSIEIDIYNYRKNGTRFWNRLLIAPVRDAAGEVIHFFANQCDVTIERESLAERTRELAQTREQLRLEGMARRQMEDAFRQARKMETVGELTSGIAHDFNNMLQAIGSCLDVVNVRVAQGQSHDAVRFVDSARKTVDRAAALTRRLLAFSRPQTLQPRSVAVDPLVRDMCELAERIVGAGIRIELDLRAGLAAVFCDPNQLENALLNLVVNARDAMPRGGSLHIRTRIVTPGDDEMAGMAELLPVPHVSLTVQDTGTGMDEATKRQALTPFFTTKAAGSGTGLGLSQIDTFVRQSGGAVGIDSVPGVGTLVRLLLPRED